MTAKRRIEQWNHEDACATWRIRLAIWLGLCFLGAAAVAIVERVL